ncbi:MAG: hypothetical protein UIH27_15610 [Ruminococcus sp.]|nr:hypothetical protein [Ruminococcus sp.]
MLTKHSYSVSSNEMAYLVLEICGLNIVSAAIMQNDFNSLKSETTQPNQQNAKKNGYVEDEVVWED